MRKMLLHLHGNKQSNDDDHDNEEDSFNKNCFTLDSFVSFQEKIVSSIETRTVLLFCLIAQLIHLHFSWIIPHL